MQKLKLRLNIPVEDISQDGLLLVLLDDAKRAILDYTNRIELLPELEGIQRELAILYYRRLGDEGVTSYSEGSISTSYETDIPSNLIARLNMYRLAKAAAMVKGIRNKKPYFYKKREITQDDEGGTVETFSEKPVLFEAAIYPAGGRIQAEVYGNRLNYILNMLYDGNEDISENDGVCVYVGSEATPDYKVISVKHYTRHKEYELEKIL